MTKTMKQIADEAELRWSAMGLSEPQKVNRRQQRQFVIHHEPVEYRPVIKALVLARRIEVDNKVDELRTARGLKDVWEL